ncbi:helix-turn-helix domain-containing protein [Catenulispora sp. NL8]|uniref:Helix-turn-helix domain-containing protein n=1 Tax=Catenulispora pinistramenti TaxID=2705254 RepID=A0ABS5L0N5_9ACTN|nr:XRE family transcriptional regulator [Catenulispora pinistramenti]MBS2551902.1 helix-turn-helix domain-containing protein [Catenulispora pinistramenti]
MGDEIPETTFAAELRRLRQRGQLTLEALADASGVSARNIGGLERGHSLGPQRRTVTALADGLGLEEADRDRLERLAEAGRARPVSGPPGWCVPPRQVPDFTGREFELARLADLASDSRPAASVVVLSGPGGVGKTTLAVAAGRRLADAGGFELFYVDLRGMDAVPLDPATALFRLLKALGVGNREIPDDVVARSGQLRALLEERPAVVVLDNARDEEQVRPLLPGAGSGVALVTSRRLLTGLEGVERLPVPVLEPEAARGLLGSIIGDPDGPRSDGLTDLAALCGGLPLALRIIGNRLATRPAWTARELADRLADSERRLGRIHAGDPQITQITAAFSMSYDQLSPAAQRLCRRLALVPGPDFTAALASVLIGASLYDAEDLLDELHELGLLAQAGEDRFGFHDLIRLFAGERFVAEESPTERIALTRALTEWLLAVAMAAASWFDPACGAAPPDWRHPVDLSTAEAAEAWLRTESDNWFGAVRVAAEQGWDRMVVDAADVLHWFSNQWLLWPHWHELFTLASAAAERMGDPVARATQLYNLSWATAQRGETEQAVATALNAVRIAEQAGAVRQQAWGLHYAARAVTMTDPAAALAYNQRAEPLFAQAEDWTGQTTVLTSVGITLAALGQPHEAIEKLRAALEIARRPPPGGAWQTIADVLLTSGNYHLAAAYEAIDEYEHADGAYRLAAANADRIGMKLHQGRVEIRLALLLKKQGRLDEAVAVLEAARAHFQEVEAVAEAAEADELLEQCRVPQ